MKMAAACTLYLICLTVLSGAVQKYGHDCPMRCSRGRVILQFLI